MKKIIVAVILFFFPIVAFAEDPMEQEIPSRASELNEQMKNYMKELSDICSNSASDCAEKQQEYSRLGSDAKEVLDSAKQYGMSTADEVKNLQQTYNVYVESAKGGFGEDWFFSLESGCDSIYGGEIGDYINDLFTLVKYAGLALVIILGTMDFLKAIASDKDDSLKQAFSRLVKRMIAVVLLFLTPALIHFTFDLLDITGSNGERIDVCTDIIK